MFYVAAPVIDGRGAAAARTRTADAAEGGLIVLDSASLRPEVTSPGGAGYVEATLNDSTNPGIHPVRVSVVTTYQGGRYHPETIRALTDDSVVLATAGSSIVSASSRVGTQLILDSQDMTPSDLPGFASLARSIFRSASARGSGRPLGIVVPPGDTVAYPTEVLARISDLIVLRLHGEHRQGTAPGPLATPEFIAREIGMRSRAIGATRLVAELPLFGYRWNGDGTAQPITFAEAQALVVSEAGAFRRDPSNEFLTASGRDGWTVWIPDARTVDFMIAAVRRRGVNQVVLAGAKGADPEISHRAAPPVRR